MGTEPRPHFHDKIPLTLLSGLLDNEFETLSDISAGQGINLPSEEDFVTPELDRYTKKYIKRKADISTEDIWRLFRMVDVDRLFLEDLADFGTGEILSVNFGIDDMQSHRRLLESKVQANSFLEPLPDILWPHQNPHGSVESYMKNRPSIQSEYPLPLWPVRKTGASLGIVET